MKQYEIDFDELPEYIGKQRGNRKDYKKNDIDAVLHWMCEQLPHNLVDVQLTVSGKLPAWLWMCITCELRDRVDELWYTTPQMADSVCIFPRD